jgi:hypothetical protein
MVFHQMIQIMMRNLWPTQKDPYANDPNHDEKSSADAERPLCKCDLDCQSHMSLDHDTYGRRYWSCPQPTRLFHWCWDKEKPQQVVSVVTFTLHILNLVVINHFIF